MTKKICDHYERFKDVLGVVNGCIACHAEILTEALVAIRDSKFCDYANTEQSQYGIGVTDGHRYCAKIAWDVLDCPHLKWRAVKFSVDSGDSRGEF